MNNLPRPQPNEEDYNRDSTLAINAMIVMALSEPEDKPYHPISLSVEPQLIQDLEKEGYEIVKPDIRYDEGTCFQN